MTPEQELELEFLRFFYEAVDDALGPASDDIYCMLKQEWVEEHECRLPEGY